MTENKTKVAKTREQKSDIENVLSDNDSLLGLFAFVVVLSNGSYFFMFLIAFVIGFFIPAWLIAQNIISLEQFTLSPYKELFKKFTDNFSLLLLVLFIFSFVNFGVFLLLFIAFVFITTAIYLIETDFFNPYKAEKKLGSDSYTTPNTDKQSQPNTDISLPLTINHHANNLYILLSAQAMPVLEELIDAVNELDNHLAYLQDNHPSLASSVHELIIDIYNNSIVHLDNIAEKFVVNGQVEDTAQQLFFNTHETKIVELFNNHLKEIKALNQSILEKKMAEFSHVGTEAERQFRDKIMELKIVLRWHIAQHPDEQSAKAHEVILHNLQETTLKQMTDAFYNVNTSDWQRQQLQQQLQELINHFQTHSAMNYQQEDDDILQLGYSANVPLPNINDDLAIQEFIEFNHNYVQQLKRHW